MSSKLFLAAPFFSCLRSAFSRRFFSSFFSRSFLLKLSMRFFDRGLQVRTNIGGQFSPLALKITCAGERAMECCDLSIIWACPALAPVHAGRARFRQGFSGRARRSFSEGGSGYPLYSSLRSEEHT